MITINATALTLDLFYIAGVGQFETRTPRVIALAPGTYAFSTLFGPTFKFSVTSAGTVDYADTNRAFLDGKGTTTLTVKGFTIKVDATALTLDQFNLNDPSSGLGEYFDTTSVQKLILIPGSYKFGTLFGSMFVFSVTAAGTVEYDANLKFLAVANKTTLVVKGFTIKVDATALTLDQFSLFDTGSGLGEYFKTASVQKLTLIPGTYKFGTLYGSMFVFSITGSGTVEYDANLKFLAVANKTTLVVKGFTIKVDATALTLDQFSLFDTGSGLGEYFKTASVQELTLIPGSYSFGTLFGSRFVFSVTGAGTVDYADTNRAFLDGKGTATLTVRGFKINMDATALTLDQFSLYDTGSGLGKYFPTTRAHLLTLIPGSYSFGTLFGPRFVFSITVEGKIDYDPGLKFLTVIDTGPKSDTIPILEVNGFLLMVDATRLKASSFSLNDSGSGLGEPFPTAVHQCVILIPGTYVFRCGFSFGFSVTGAGMFDYHPAFAACVTGLGTQRLRVTCDPTNPPV